MIVQLAATFAAGDEPREDSGFACLQVALAGFRAGLKNRVDERLLQLADQWRLEGLAIVISPDDFLEVPGDREILRFRPVSGSISLRCWP